MEKEQEDDSEGQNGEAAQFVREVLSTVQESLNVKRLVRNSVKNVAAMSPRASAPRPSASKK